MHAEVGHMRGECAFEQPFAIGISHDVVTGLPARPVGLLNLSLKTSTFFDWAEEELIWRTMTSAALIWGHVPNFFK